MNKRWLLSLLWALFISFALSSCEPETILLVNQNTISVKDTGGPTSVSFTANKAWTASSDQSWCKVSPSGGDASDNNSVSITVNCDANTTYDTRSCTITIQCAELTKAVTVTQETNLGLLVSPTSFDLSNAAQDVNIEVKANVQFDVSIDTASSSWIKFVSTKGLTTNTVTLSVSENTDYDGREGKVTISQKGGSLTETVTIRQSQTDGLFINTLEYNLSKEDQSLNVEVLANVPLEISSEAEWIHYAETKALSTSILVFHIDANSTYYPRQGKIMVSDKGGKIQRTITINQEQTDALFITDEIKEHLIASSGGAIVVNVFHNIDFEVEASSLPDWLSHSTAEIDNYNSQIVFSINKNTEYFGRSVSFILKGKELSDSFCIKQHQVDTVYSDRGRIEALWKEGEISVNIYSNVDFSIDDVPEWISLSTQKHETVPPLTLHTFVYEVEMNLDEERSGQIVINWMNEGKEESIQLEISQQCCTIDMQTSGSLISELGGDLYKKVSKLIIKGDINGTDVLLIRRMSSLKYLDLYESRIVAGGIAYYESYYTEQDCIGEMMFAYLNTIQTMILPKGIKSIGQHAFAHNLTIKSIRLPEGLETVGFGAFDNCSSLKEVNIPSTLHKLEDALFNNSAIEELYIPETVSTLGWYVFGACTQLKTITIPRSITTIGSRCFDYCYALSEIHFKPYPDDITLGENIFPESYKRAILYIPKGTFEKYFLTELGNFETIIEE